MVKQAEKEKTKLFKIHTPLSRLVEQCTLDRRNTFCSKVV